MVKTKFAILIDSFMISFLIFAINFIWINKFIKNAILTFLIPFFVGILMFFVIFLHLKKKNNLQKLKLKDLKLAENSFLQINLYSKAEKQIFFEKLFNAKNITSNLFLKDKILFFVEINATVDVKDFTEINDIVKTNKVEKVILITEKQTDDFLNILNLSKINYVKFSKVDLFKFMKEKNYFPEIIETKKQNKLQKLKKTISSSITRSNFKNFFVSGMSLIFISMFIPFSIYYLIFGTLFLIVSIICLFLKNQIPTSKTNEDLSKIIKGD